MPQENPAGFDPYREFLGVPSGGQRPTHYALLGLPPFAGDPVAIQEAVRRRLDQLESHRQTPHRDAWETVRGAVEAARDCLGDRPAKEAYDRKLRAEVLMRPETREQYRSREAGPAGSPRPGELGDSAEEDSPKPPTPGKSAIGGGGTRQAPPRQARSVPQPPPQRPRRGGPGAGPPTPPPVRSKTSMASHPNYEILRQIGRGRYATVYQAYDRSLHRYVAIKQLDPTFCSDRTELERFWDEARFLANLHHANIVTVHAIDVQRGWIIMELMNGNLADKVAEGPMAPPLVRSVLRQALEGLAYLHSQDNLHGEISPANLLIDDGGHVKLSASTGFRAGGEFRLPEGSQRHVAPELLNSHVFGPVGPAVDLYCLGFATLELLIGPRFAKLFKGVDKEGDHVDIAWMRWHNSPTETLPPVRELVPQIPDDLAVVIDRLIKKPVAERYASAEEALEDLENKPLILMDVAEGDPADAEAGRRGPGAVALGSPPDLGRGAASPAKKDKEKPSKKASRRLTRSETWKGIAEKPHVLYPLCAALVLLILILLFLSGNGASNEPRRVEVASRPSGAVIFVDGQRNGSPTPAELALAPGTHKIRLEADGYEPYETELDIPADEDPPPFWFSMKKKAGTPPDPVPPETKHPVVAIETTPPGAAVSLNGTPFGKATPAELPLTPGRYQLRLELAQYQPLERVIRVTEAASQHFHYALVPVPPPPPVSDEKNDPLALPPSDASDQDASSVADDGPAADPGRIEPTPDDFLVVHWPLPDRLSDQQRAAYVDCIWTMMNACWRASVLEGPARARQAFERAVAICPDDPRSYYGYGLVLYKHHSLRKALDLWTDACAKTGDLPYWAPHRQVVRLYLYLGDEASAASESWRLVSLAAAYRDSGRPQTAAGQPFHADVPGRLVAHPGKGRAAARGADLAARLLQENVRFAGHVFGYLRARGGVVGDRARFPRGVPLARFESLIQRRLDAASQAFFRRARDEMVQVYRDLSIKDADSLLPDSPSVMALQGDSVANPRGPGKPPLASYRPTLDTLRISPEWERELLLRTFSQQSPRHGGPAAAPDRAVAEPARRSAVRARPLVFASW